MQARQFSSQPQMSLGQLKTVLAQGIQKHNWASTLRELQNVFNGGEDFLPGGCQLQNELYQLSAIRARCCSASHFLFLSKHTRGTYPCSLLHTSLLPLWHKLWFIKGIAGVLIRYTAVGINKHVSVWIQPFAPYFSGVNLRKGPSVIHRFLFSMELF